MTEIKIFKDLNREIIEPHICSLCGGCVSICSTSQINAIEIIDGVPVLVKSDENKCLECGLCYQICPRTETIPDKFKEDFISSDSLGFHKKLTWAQTNDKEIRKICQDGGVITSFLKYLLDTKQVDGVIVNIGLPKWDSCPLFITSSEQLLAAAGTRYSVTPLLEIFQKPKVFTGSKHKVEEVTIPYIQSLMELNRFDYARLAFVGCPCHILAIRKMQYLNARPATMIKYLIGLFCMENFTYSSLMKEKIEKDLKYKLNDIKKVNIKKNFIITLKNNSVVEIPFKEIEEVTRPNCLFCPDLTNLYSDISVGGIGAPEKYSTVAIRTDVGEKLFEGALIGNYISEYKDSDENMVKLDERVRKIIQRMTKTKSERAAKNLKQVKGSGN